MDFQWYQKNYKEGTEEIPPQSLEKEPGPADPLFQTSRMMREAMPAVLSPPVCGHLLRQPWGAPTTAQLIARCHDTQCSTPRRLPTTHANRRGHRYSHR